MKAIFSNYRYYALFAVSTVAVLGIFAVPADSLPFFTWIWVLFSTKVVGFAACWLFHLLFTRWEKRNTIPELIEFTNEF